jgi:glutathione S-transferase
MLTLTLYHYDRSTACQRVRLALEEKGLAWESHVVDTARGDASQLPGNYHEINPSGLVPALVHDGRAVAESLVILEYLEDAFPEVPLRPADPYARALMRQWMRRIDAGIHVASRVIGVCVVMRHSYLARPPEQLAGYYASMRDQVRRDNDRVNIEKGLDSPLLAPALGAFKRLFTEMDAALATSPWLAGGTCSLADIALVVYLGRLASFEMAPLWRDRTHLTAWRDRIAARPAFTRAITQWGDRTSAERTRHGREAFARVSELWQAA